MRQIKTLKQLAKFIFANMKQGSKCLVDGQLGSGKTTLHNLLHDLIEKNSLSTFKNNPPILFTPDFCIIDREYRSLAGYPKNDLWLDYFRTEFAIEVAKNILYPGISPLHFEAYERVSGCASKKIEYKTENNPAIFLEGIYSSRIAKFLKKFSEFTLKIFLWIPEDISLYRMIQRNNSYDPAQKTEKLAKELYFPSAQRYFQELGDTTFDFLINATDFNNLKIKKNISISSFLEEETKIHEEYLLEV